MKRLNAGVWGGITVLAFGLLFFAYSLEYPYKGDIGVGAGFFPLWLSGILIVLAVLYILESLAGRDKAEKTSKEAMKNILFTVICMVAYVILLPIIGFNVTSTAFLFVLLLKAYKWHLNLLISIVSSVALYFLFLLLGVQLPLNALGF
jgi:hypothetical protein